MDLTIEPEMLHFFHRNLDETLVRWNDGTMKMGSDVERSPQMVGNVKDALG